MRRYRTRSVLLLFGVLYLTGYASPYRNPLYSWQSVPNPAQFIEENRPEQARVTTDDVTELEVLAPSVEGDSLVAFRNFSISFADIRLLEVRALSVWRVAAYVVSLPIAIWSLYDLSQGGPLY
jgi:hypothetical protein